MLFQPINRNNPSRMPLPISVPPKLPIDCMLFTRLLSDLLNDKTAMASVAMSCVADAVNEIIIKTTMA